MSSGQSTSDAFNSGKQAAEQNPQTEKLTEQQQPNYALREAHNGGIDSAKK